MFTSNIEPLSFCVDKSIFIILSPGERGRGEILQLAIGMFLDETLCNSRNIVYIMTLCIVYIMRLPHIQMSL